MLSSILLESAGLGHLNCDASPEMIAKYGYDSEHRIAMESTLELNDIFYESFYKMEELDFQYSYATMEGVSDAVLEGIGSSIKERARNAFNKIKKFLKDLWEKVKAFFHNVRRFLDGVFMNAQDFVKKYEKELNKLTFSDKDYEVEMYNYTFDDGKLGLDVAAKVSEACSNVAVSGDNLAESIAKFAVSHVKQTQADMVTGPAARAKAIALDAGERMGYTPDTSKQDREIEGLQKGLEEFGEERTKKLNAVIAAAYKSYGLSDDFEMNDLAQAVWSACRGGASDSNDKKTITIKSLSEYISYLKGSKKLLSDFAKAEKANNKVFADALKAVDRAEKIVDKDDNIDAKVKDLAVKVCHGISSTVSRGQTISNTIVANVRTALNEKIASYKKVCTGAFSHADKKKKDKDK